MFPPTHPNVADIVGGVVLREILDLLLAQFAKGQGIANRFLLIGNPLKLSNFILFFILLLFVQSLHKRMIVLETTHTLHR